MPIFRRIVIQDETLKPKRKPAAGKEGPFERAKLSRCFAISDGADNENDGSPYNGK